MPEKDEIELEGASSDTQEALPEATAVDSSLAELRQRLLAVNPEEWITQYAKMIPAFCYIQNRLNAAYPQEWYIGRIESDLNNNYEEINRDRSKERLFKGAFLYELLHCSDYAKKYPRIGQYALRVVLRAGRDSNSGVGYEISSLLRNFPILEGKKIILDQPGACSDDTALLLNLAEAWRSGKTYSEDEQALIRQLRASARADLFGSAKKGPRDPLKTFFRASRYYVPTYTLPDVVRLQLETNPEALQELCALLHPYLDCDIRVIPEMTSYWLRGRKIPDEDKLYDQICRLFPPDGTSSNRDLHASWTLGNIIRAKKFVDECTPFREQYQKHGKEPAEQRKKEQQHNQADEKMRKLMQNLPVYQIVNERTMMTGCWEKGHYPEHSFWHVHVKDEGSVDYIAFYGLARSLETKPEGRQAVKEQLTTTSRQVQEKLKQEVHAAFIQAAPRIRDFLLAELKPEEETLTGYQECIGKLEKARDHYRELPREKDEADLVPAYALIADGLHQRCEELGTELPTLEEKVRNRRLESVTREYLLEDVALRITYLRKLYAAATGLDLSNIDGHAAEHEGGNIGYVVSGSPSMGMGMELRMEQRQIIAQLLTHQMEGIYLEMGDEEADLKDVMLRAKMVDWVGPHEVGHMVQWATGEKEKEWATSQQPKIDGIVRLIPQHKDAATEMMRMTAQECVVDGLGFRLAIDHGTSDPALRSGNDRLRKVTESFTASLQILRGVIEKRAVDPEMKMRYAVIALRTLAVCDKLKEKASELKCAEAEVMLDEERSRILETLTALEQDALIPTEAKEQATTLFQISFEYAQSLSLQSDKEEQ